MIGSCEITEQLRNKTKQDVLTGSILDLQTGETEDVSPVLFLLYRKLLPAAKFGRNPKERFTNRRNCNILY